MNSHTEFMQHRIREAAVADAIKVLDKAEHHPLPERLAAVAILFKHGTAGGMGDSAALDRMSQGIAFLCEAMGRRSETARLIDLLEDLRKRNGLDAADTNLITTVSNVLRDM